MTAIVATDCVDANLRREGAAPNSYSKLSGVCGLAEVPESCRAEPEFSRVAEFVEIRGKAATFMAITQFRQRADCNRDAREKPNCGLTLS